MTPPLSLARASTRPRSLLARFRRDLQSGRSILSGPIDGWDNRFESAIISGRAYRIPNSVGCALYAARERNSKLADSGTVSNSRNRSLESGGCSRMAERSLVGSGDGCGRPNPKSVRCFQPPSIRTVAIFTPDSSALSRGASRKSMSFVLTGRLRSSLKWYAAATLPTTMMCLWCSAGMARAIC